MIDVNDIDSKIIAAVLRRQQEVAVKESFGNLDDLLVNQGVPARARGRIMVAVQNIIDRGNADFNKLIEPFENGDVSFDDTVIKMTVLGMQLSTDAAETYMNIVMAEQVDGLGLEGLSFDDDDVYTN
ncbi:MAG: hypothetical protein H8E55_08420 [Pelagibacterales bacterium]|nr:hypothetical protein [Pelagibacterales bacterium]